MRSSSPVRAEIGYFLRASSFTLDWSEVYHFSLTMNVLQIKRHREQLIERPLANRVRERKGGGTKDSDERSDWCFTFVDCWLAGQSRNDPATQPANVCSHCNKKLHPQVPLRTRFGSVHSLSFCSLLRTRNSSLVTEQLSMQARNILERFRIVQRSNLLLRNLPWLPRHHAARVHSPHLPPSSLSTMAPPEYVTLKSREDVSIRVESKILEKSVLLYDMFNGMHVVLVKCHYCSHTFLDVDEAHAAEEVPIPNVSEAVLRKVIHK